MESACEKVGLVILKRRPWI